MIYFNFSDTFRTQVGFHQCNTTKYDVFLNDTVISLNSILSVTYISYITEQL